jgi:TolB-like protein
VELSARSFDILTLLLDRPGEMVSKDALFAAAWPGLVVEENTLQVHISALRKALDPGMIATVHGRGYKYSGPVPGTEASPEVPEASGAAPVIVVLPFENLSGDPEQQYFSDGITQDIIDRLTRFPVMLVIGLGSTIMLRGTAPDIDVLRESLGADFIVTGNIRRSESRIRISVRLTDAATRKSIWAEHYDRPLTDLFDIQDEVAEMVAATISRELEIEIAGRSMRRHPTSLKSYELILLGVWHYYKQTREGAAEAIDCFNRALAGDPGSVEALGWLGVTKCMHYETDFDYDELLQGISLISQCIARDPGNAQAYVGYSLYVGVTEGIEPSRAAIDHALSLNPGDIYANVQRALVAIYEGDNDLANEWLRRSHKLSPNPLPWVAEYAALIAFQDGRYREAMQGLAAKSGCAWQMMYLIACHGHLDELDKARDIVARFAAEGRVFDYLAAAAREPYRNPESRERLINGLKLALPQLESQTAGP